MNFRNTVHRFFAVCLFAFGAPAYSDVVVPYARDLRACLRLSNSVLSTQATDALKVLLLQPQKAELTEWVELSTVVSNPLMIDPNWTALKMTEGMVKKFRPNVTTTLHTTQFIDTVPRGNLNRDLCKPDEIQANFIRSGHSPHIEDANPCTPSRFSFCNVRCDGDLCELGIGTPGIPPTEQVEPTSRSFGLMACVPSAGNSLSVEDEHILKFLLSTDFYPDYREEARISMQISGAGAKADMEKMTKIRDRVIERRPHISAVSLTLSSHSGIKRRFGNLCPAENVSVFIDRIGKAPGPSPCLPYFGFCTVKCADSQCRFTSN